jgi:DNA polymerase III sliding clamp (beta) subunit (PCNA family)
VATDGKAAAVLCPTGITAPESFSIILPLFAAPKIRAVLDQGGDCEWAFHGNTLAISAGCATVHTQLIDGK